MTKDNHCLGKFNLDSIPPMPRGQPQVEVTFDIDANGILHVKALDKASNKEQKITITSSSTLSKEEVENLVKTAKQHEGEDKKKREAVEEKNKAEGLIFEVEKNLKEHKEKLPEADVKAIEDAVAKTKTAVESGDVEKIKAANAELQQAAFKIGEAMYKQAPGAAGPEGAAPGAEAGNAQEKKKDDNVVDAEFEEN